MRRRLLLILVIAVLTALVGSTLAYRAIAARTAVPAPAATTTQVAVAARDLRMGTTIQLSDLQLTAWPGSPNPRWVSKAEDLDGRSVVANIYQGEPFLESRLAARGGAAGLAASIPDGMRAVAVHVDDIVGVSGFVLAGMRVDVLSTGALPGQASIVTRTVLQNIQVLSAGQNADSQGKPGPVQVVNLLVTPEQAETIGLAAAQTKIQLVLRNSTDEVVAVTPGISNDRLLGGAAPKSTARTPKPQPVAGPRLIPEKPQELVTVPLTVDVITGTKKNSIVVGQTTQLRTEEQK
jgi:pilus assembly protein CpaB